MVFATPLAVASVAGLFVLAFASMPLWFRAVNEVTTRTVGRAVTICPYCGLPGVVRTTDPQVFR
jgi:hypothetical protein